MQIFVILLNPLTLHAWMNIRGVLIQLAISTMDIADTQHGWLAACMVNYSVIAMQHSHSDHEQYHVYI